MKKHHLFAAAATALAVSLVGAPLASAAETDPIAANAAADPQFSTLVAALGAADLVGAFDDCSDAPTTVFAPTNAAFSAALSSLGLTAEQLLADTETLTSILTYHVVAGEVPAADVVGLDQATTLNGAPVSIAVENGGVVLNGDVNVVATDVRSCNGIIHVIDGVLLPPSLTQAADTTALPATGADAATIAAFAAGLLAIGGLGLFTARRRAAEVEA